MVEDRGIDEIYVDLTDAARRHEPTAAARSGRALKAAVHAATGLTCSIGVTPNKLLAEDLLRPRQARRPDAARRSTTSRRASGRWPRSKINGIGPKASGEAGRARHRDDRRRRRRRSGAAGRSSSASSFGAWLHEAAHGRDERPVVTAQRAGVDQPRDDLRARPARGARPRRARRDLHASCASSSPATCRARATPARRSASSCASTTSGSVTRDLTLPAHTLDAREIRRAAGLCLKRVDLSRRLRLLGVRAGGAGAPWPSWSRRCRPPPSTSPRPPPASPRRRRPAALRRHARCRRVTRATARRSTAGDRRCRSIAGTHHDPELPCPSSPTSRTCACWPSGGCRACSTTTPTPARGPRAPTAPTRPTSSGIKLRQRVAVDMENRTLRTTDGRHRPADAGGDRADRPDRHAARRRRDPRRARGREIRHPVHAHHDEHLLDRGHRRATPRRRSGSSST